MPVHDWTRVTAGTFHDFDGSWITHLKETLNEGLLPKGYYAMADQHAKNLIPDVMTLQMGENKSPAGPDNGKGSVALAPPRVSRRIVMSEKTMLRFRRRTLTIRQAPSHRIVALIEIVSPANKDRKRSVEQFAEKIESALAAGCHVLLVDLFPPGPFDPQGMHAAIWEGSGEWDDDDDEPPFHSDLTLASYLATDFREALLEPLAVGDVLPDMPLYLDVGLYVNVPLEKTYQDAYRGMASFLRDIIEGRASA